MNSTEQRTHKKAITTLEADTLALIEAQSRVCREVERALRHDLAVLRMAVGEERTHRLKLADEQRAYVDSADTALRRCCQERWDETARTTKRLWDSLAALDRMTVWQRLYWLVMGR